MEKVKGKAETYIGFAIRKGSAKIGVNAVATLKRAKLVIICKSASENTVKDGEKLAKKLGATLLTTKEKLLSEMTYKDNAKVMAITDAQLAKAIVESADNNF